MTDGRSELAEIVAEAVRRERAGRRLRQEDLAARLGWSRASVADLEQGRRRCTLEDAEALCVALDISLPTLVGGGATERSREACRALGIVGPWMPDDDLRRLALRLTPGRVAALRAVLGFVDDQPR